MIDNITLIKNKLTDYEKLQVIEKNNLQSFVNETNNSRIYDNAKYKNLTGGILIKIYGDKLKIEGSIHKYFNYLQFGTLENYTVFSMQDFLKTIEILFKNIGITELDFLIINYEIGLNVFVIDNEPFDYLKNARSVGNLDGMQRKLYINPRYKNESFLCTQMHKDNTLIFRIYDKGFERMDKGKKIKIPPCIRIETKRTRQKNLSLSEFCKPINLLLSQNKFITEWNKLNFEKEITAPPGTHQSKKELAKKILLDGKTVVLQELEENRQYSTPKIYRTSKHFIKNWEDNKFDFTLKNSQIQDIWEKYYNTAIQLVAVISFKN